MPVAGVEHELSQEVVEFYLYGVYVLRICCDEVCYRFCGKSLCLAGSHGFDVMAGMC